MRLTSLLALIAFAGCHRMDLDVSAGSDLQLLIYDHGRIAADCPLDSSQQATVQLWLDSHPSGWTPTIVTAVPRVYVTAPEFTINFTEPHVVVNYEGGQYILEVTSQEFPALSCPQNPE